MTTSLNFAGKQHGITSCSLTTPNGPSLTHLLSLNREIFFPVNVNVRQNYPEKSAFYLDSALVNVDVRRFCPEIQWYSANTWLQSIG